MDINMVEFCKYLQPIVNGCAGFIKTDGFMLHTPGHIYMMSADETFFSHIEIPAIYNIMLVANINSFLRCKESEQQEHVLENIQFFGSNIKAGSLLKYAEDYVINIDQSMVCDYYEPDCMNSEEFREKVNSSTEIGYIVKHGCYDWYRIPVSKCITPINKGDICELKIYRYIGNIDNKRLVRYIVHKKKMKLDINIYCNIMMI